MSTFFRNNLLLTALLLVSLFVQKSHAQREVCGFDHFYKRQLQDPRAAAKIQSANLKIGNIQRSLDAARLNRKTRDVMPGPGGGNLYQIPVVVHIMHRSSDGLGSEANPTDAIIQQMIDFLNQVYAGTNISSGGVSTPLRFVLAKRTPDCQATNGINRVVVTDNRYQTDGLQDEPGGPGMPEAALKALSRWPVAEYYNIWIVHKIYSTDPTTITNGYAYFPGAGDLDGTVLRGGVANGTAQTLPHEMGHALALYHTFEGGDDGVNCPANTGDCSVDGDKVCDTDPHLKRYDCPAADDPLDRNKCVDPPIGVPWGLLPKNIMSYFDCRDRFSPGQGSRMQATMLTERYGLVSSLGGTAPSPTPVTAVAHDQLETVSVDPNEAYMGPVLVRLNTLYYSSEAYRSSSRITYEDKTCTAGTTINHATAYEIAVNTEFNQQLVKVWIDLNNDGIYSAGELIGTSTGAPGNYLHKISLTTAKLSQAGTVYNKPLRMRVGADWAGNPNYGYNTKLQYGQMEDFAVTISDAVLPVNFGAIDAFIKDGQLNVKWTSETETNNDRYLVQLSQDGTAFYTIGTVKTLAVGGNSNTPVDYHFSIDKSGITGAAAGLMLLALGSLGGVKRRKRLSGFVLGMMILALLGISNSCSRKQEALAQDKMRALFLRIAQVDKDETTHYSKVIKVSGE
ncbi:M43 family zinc metalloprotease [Niabella hirudinis]|uniref:M43 family zinc metalloprotease n=1 Tax=Niabella hirudinis TaxID=1285929 RepID=UPI003EBE4A6E